jgi:spore coat polysaccharide biosynthesis predicted glycosyltransferase SpsG
VLGSDYKNMMSDFDKESFYELIIRSESIIVDSYYVSDEYFNRIREARKDNQNNVDYKIFYIDDLCEKAYSVDVLINYNIYADVEKYKSLYSANDNQTVSTSFIIGPQYVPLRKEFSKVERIKIKEKVTDALIMTGGADMYHVSFNLVKALKETVYGNNANIKDTCFHFVIGAMSGDYSSILNELAGSKNIMIHKDVKEIWTLMSSCDIAVSAAGTSLYELCACGVPTITYVLADNQMNGEKAFVDNKAMLSIGDIRVEQNYCERIIKAVIDLADDFTLRKQMADRETSITDGSGASKLADLLIG